MDQSVCRAITLYSYHIPITTSSLNAQYSTIGFFDGMSTKRIAIDYKKEDLKALWQYTTEQTKECDGSYSFQNIFALADDEWNDNCTDEEFWDIKTDREYPLTMVVCLQLKNYMQEYQGIQKQCEELNSIVYRNIKDGLGYTYCTIDKNEVIVCLKCKNYHEAVRTIKALHTIRNNTVAYGYTVFSVNHEVLQQLSQEAYPYLYDEEIESICFKGITNSIKDEQYNLTLDEKYYDFCEKLTEKLYSKEERFEKVSIKGQSIATGKYKDRTYDILGDDDFRYIAREVKLGRLLYEYRKDGLLSYSNSEFAFYLFSSSLVLNTQTNLNQKVELSSGEVGRIGEYQISSNAPKRCNGVTEILTSIRNIIENKYNEDDKVWSIYYALHQLLQSFKVLEVSPAKRYDFFSMFPPFEMLTEIVEEKLEEENGNRLAEQDEIFEFIHKISMTFHSAQRTDIQFFQIQDFNVIVHYAPAKLRAFYAVWILNLAELYKQFKGKEKKKYSFIFAPGMFGNTRVRQLVFCGETTKRLMLVTLPDRSVYQIKRLLIVLSHEAAHVGCKRQREERHNYALKACARAAILELHAFMLCEINNWGGQLDAEIFINAVREDKHLLQELEEVLLEESQAILSQFGDKGEWNEIRDNECRRTRSKVHTDKAFSKMLQKYGEKIIAEYCSQLKNTYLTCGNKKGNGGEYGTLVSGFFVNAKAELPGFIKIFHNIQLKKILDTFYYIEEEAFADLVTILTLEHSMEDYIFSFTEDEITQESLGETTKVTAAIVRMALVIEVAGEVAEHDWKGINRPDFINEWKKGRLKEVCIKFPRHSVEEMIAAKILCYYNAITNFSEQIGYYQRMYNAEEYGYTDIAYGFFTDEEVWKALYSYLYMSAKTYIKMLSTSGDMQIYTKKCEMANIYKKLKRASTLDVVQVIEDFLYRYESERGGIRDKKA